MKTKVMIMVSLVFGGLFVAAQSPQEERAQKMMDSIMQNMPENQKALMQQLIQMGETAEAQRKKEKAQAKKTEVAKNRAAHKKSEEEFYWRNRIASDTQGRFKNWSYGAADIKARFYNHGGSGETFLKMGTISADGAVTLNLPQLDFREWAKIPITKPTGEGDVMLFATDHLKFSNKNVKHFSTQYSLGVYQGDRYLGFLNMGNAVRPVVNIGSPCCGDRAGDGYVAYWGYMSQANSITGIKGENPKVEHDLQFEAGWNLIMIRVEGVREGTANGSSGIARWKNQYFTATTALPADAQFFFTKN